MPYGVSNSFKRGLFPRTYARRNRQALEVDDAARKRERAPEDQPCKRVKMNDAGFVEEDILFPPRGSKATPTNDAADATEKGSEVATQTPQGNTNCSSTEIVHQEDLAASECPSTPTPSDCFSSGIRLATSSPPSSPPPRALELSPPQTKASKPAFSFMKRKRSLLTPLDPSRENARSPALVSEQSKKPRRLTQMCIDLGGETSIKCKECGMEYVPSNEEDDGLHRDWHGMHVGGVDLGKGFVKEGFLRVVEGLGHGERIVLVERGSVLGAKRKARKVLDVVSRELGAVDIADEELWGSGPGVKAKKKNVGEKNQGKEDRFKMVLYLMGEKCVGLCLAERISHASKVVGAENDTSANMPAARSSSILTGPSTDPAILGISRIWTSTSHREKGIATALLDCARGHFFYGVEVPKDMVAFSQPTESGGRLAERWFGQRTGWHVYADDGGQRVQEEGC